VVAAPRRLPDRRRGAGLQLPRNKGCICAKSTGVAAVQRRDRRGVVGWTLAVLGPALIVVGILGLALGWGSSTTATPASQRAPSSPAAVAPVAESPAAFLHTFETAIAAGNTSYLVSRLHPVVIRHFGAAQCAASLKSSPVQPEAFQLISVSKPGVFDYQVAGSSTKVPGVSTFTVRGPVSGIQHFHFARLGGRWYWFTDCGTSSGA